MVGFRIIHIDIPDFRKLSGTPNDPGPARKNGTIPSGVSGKDPEN
jgi:hypothetical protein